MPGPPEVGETLLGDAKVIELTGTSLISQGQAGGVVLYRPVEASPMRYEAWLGVDEPELEIERVTAADGLEEGSIRGNVSFEAAGLLMETDGSVQHVVRPLADTTVHVYMEFDVPLRQALSGGVTSSPRVLSETARARSPGGSWAEGRARGSGWAA